MNNEIVNLQRLASCLRALAVVLVITLASTAAFAQGLPLKDCNGTPAYLCQGDIIVADANIGPPPGFSALFLLNPTTGALTLIASGGLLDEVAGVVVEPNGNLVVTDRNNGVIRVNPATGGTTPLGLPGGPFTDFFGIARGTDGNFIVADSGYRANDPSNPVVNVPGRILKVDATTGVQTVIAQGGNIVHPYGVAIDPLDGSIVMSDMSAFGGQGGIIRIDPVTFSQQVVWGPASVSPQVVQSHPFNCPMGITVEGSGNILATVFTYPASGVAAYGCSAPGIFRVDLMSAPQAQVTITTNLNTSPQLSWDLPFGIDTEANGKIIVGDEGSGAIFRMSSTVPFNPSDSLANFIFPLLLSPGVVHPVSLSVVRNQPTVNVGQPPTATINGAPASSPEGTAINLTSTVSGSGTPTYSWTVTKDGSSYASGSAASLDFTPNDNGTYVAGLIVTTSAGSSTASATTTVTNVAPSVGIANIPSSSLEGTAISLTSTVTDPGTADTAAGFTSSWTVLKNGLPFATSPNFTPNDNGIYAVTLTVTDKDGGAGTATTNLNVTNVAPSATINGAPASGLVGTPINLTSSVSDPGSADTAAGFTYVWSVTRNGNPFASGTASILSFTPNASGSYVVTLTARDKDNATGTDSKTVNVVVLPPTVTINGAPASSPEGTAINLTSTVSGTGPFAYSWAVTRNGSPFASGSGSSLSFTPNNNGTYVASLSVTNSGGTGIASVSISATNVAPAITLTNGPLIPLPEPSSTTVSLNFTDPGATDAHTCLFAWDDGSSNTVAGSTGSGSCSLSHVFTAQGVYTVSVTVADADGGSAVGMWRYVVIYDPDAGSVNGNGEVNSPATSLRYMTLPGTAKFGFTAKYKKGVSVPDGNTEFQVKINKFKFKSTTYDWLVVNGHKAQFKGSGTVKIHGQNHANDADCEDEDHFVNVSGAFAFTLTAHDGSLTTDGKDRFRIKIVNKTTNEVVYDSMPGTGDDPDGFSPLVITKGKITIRKN